MKIGFSGAQGTGKTSVARVVGRTPGWSFVPSVSSDAVKAGYKVNKEADPISQLVTTCARIALEFRANESANRNVVLDRTLVDSLSYTIFQKNFVWTEQNDFYLDVSKDLVRKQMQEYDAVFYYPVLWAPKLRSDGLRSADIEYQKTIDTIVLELLNEMRPDYITMPDMSVETRAQFVLSSVDWL